MPVLAVIAAGAVVTFLVYLLVAAIVYYVAGLFLPHPIPALIAAIIVVIAVASLL